MSQLPAFEIRFDPASDAERQLLAALDALPDEYGAKQHFLLVRLMRGYASFLRQVCEIEEAGDEISEIERLAETSSALDFVTLRAMLAFRRESTGEQSIVTTVASSRQKSNAQVPASAQSVEDGDPRGDAHAQPVVVPMAVNAQAGEAISDPVATSRRASESDVDTPAFDWSGYSRLAGGG